MIRRLRRTPELVLLLLVLLAMAAGFYALRQADERLDREVQRSNDDRVTTSELVDKLRSACETRNVRDAVVASEVSDLGARLGEDVGELVEALAPRDCVALYPEVRP